MLSERKQWRAEGFNPNRQFGTAVLPIGTTPLLQARIILTLLVANINAITTDRCLFNQMTNQRPFHRVLDQSRYVALRQFKSHHYVF